MTATDHLALAVATVASLAGKGTVIGPDTALRDLADYNSLFLARLVEAIEDACDLEIPAEEVLPANFATPAAIARLLDALTRQSA